MSSIPSISPGARCAHRVGDGAERAVEVVVDRQEVAGEPGRAIDLGVAAVALGALADVLDVGERPEQPVLQVGDLGAQRRRLVGGGRLVGDLLVVERLGLGIVEERVLDLFHQVVLVLALRHLVHSPLALAAARDQPPDQLRGVVDDRDDPAVVQPGRPDHAHRADDLAVRIHIGRDHQRGTRK